MIIEEVDEDELQEKKGAEGVESSVSSTNIPQVTESNAVVIDGARVKLLPDDPVTVSREDVSAEYDKIGEQRIWTADRCTVEFTTNTQSGFGGFVIDVLDTGEMIGVESNKCHWNGEAGSHRRDGGAKKLYEDTRRSSEAWRQHYSGKDGADDWDTVIANLDLQPMSQVVKDLQLDAVTSNLARGQGIVPIISCIAVQDDMKDRAELKVYLTSKQTWWWQVLVTSDCLTAEGTLKREVPVVVTFLTPSHVSAAVMRSVKWKGKDKLYDEDLQTVSTETWGGLRLGELQDMYDGVAAQMKMTWVMALTMTQTLKHLPIKRPSFVRQPGLPQRECGKSFNCS